MSVIAVAPRFLLPPSRFDREGMGCLPTASPRDGGVAGGVASLLSGMFLLEPARAVGRGGGAAPGRRLRWTSESVLGQAPRRTRRVRSSKWC
jgi:hypothetical protein